jgi:hypothetical protein
MAKRSSRSVGVVRNQGEDAKRYIYVRVDLKKGRQVIVSAKAPAGNVFTVNQISTMDKASMNALLNPAGKDGSNAKVVPGGSVAFTVVFTELPEDFAPGKYQFEAKIAQAERYEGP